MNLHDPEALNRLVGDVAAELAALGLHDAARRFTLIRGTAYTTGSEWLGELGTAASDIRRRHRLPPSLDAKLERILVEARRVWPAL